MTALITDDILAPFVVAGTWEQLPPLLDQRYAGLPSDIPFTPAVESEADAERAADLVARIKAIPSFARVQSTTAGGQEMHD